MPQNLLLCHINTVYTTPHNLIQCQKIRYYNTLQTVYFDGTTQRIIILCRMSLGYRGVVTSGVCVKCVRYDLKILCCRHVCHS
jgi:hypothetical protein